MDKKISDEIKKECMLLVRVELVKAVDEMDKDDLEFLQK